jgi:hypothetical protein
MIALADSDFFRQGILLLKWGIPYECIFGEKRIWSRNWRNAATVVMNDFHSPEESMGLG